ncbi:MAG: response regulator transcription factor [Sedimentisphaerales bacterium]|jgi:DNA-binding NarL/FixJ family response regulator|nr:response regulator transcription factor [Sedimentisphaerales bacterium]NLT75952.1 response regulator transcription factor [Planctomycetota bacterium]
MAAKGIRIVLADDHAIVRQGLSRAIQQEDDIEVVGQTSRGGDAVELVRTLRPDILITDISMPDLNGVEATRRIIGESPEMKVIALSMHSSRQFVIEMFRAGARGYLLKDCEYDELVTAIRTVAAGRTYVSPSIGDVIVEDLLGGAAAGAPSTSSVLTQREREVLQLMAEGRTTRQIALQLHISPKTVEAHRLRIMNKLDIDNVAQLTKYAIQEGLTSPDI